MIDEILDHLPRTHRWVTPYEVEMALAGNAEYTNRMVQIRVGTDGDTPMTDLAIFSLSGEDDHGNVKARDCIDRCTCGGWYWENDHCADCGGYIEEAVA